MGLPERGANEKGLLALWIFWAAGLGSLFIYVLVCHEWADAIQQSVSPNFPLDLMRNILYGFAIFTLLLTHFLRKGILAGRSGSSGPMCLKPQLLSNQPSVLGRYMKAVIVSLALSEGVGIYGFALFLLGDDFRTLHMLIGISAIAMFFYRPKTEELERLALAMQTKEAPAPEV